MPVLNLHFKILQLSSTRIRVKSQENNDFLIYEIYKKWNIKQV